MYFKYLLRLSAAIVLLETLAVALPIGNPLLGVPHQGKSLGNQFNQECEENYMEMYLDHFGRASAEGCQDPFKIRYFICEHHWSGPAKEGEPEAPIFFYAGNEADVSLYIKHAGLMFENAQDFGALLIFAEHRYYGKSLPCNSGKYQFLTSEQAMADYVVLLYRLKQKLGVPHAPIITFGGSYGGMLSAWLRMKYPHIITGAIAASAPIWNYVGEEPEFDPFCFYRVVSEDATAKGGAPAECANNIRKSWGIIEELWQSQKGRDKVWSQLGMCGTSGDTPFWALRNWLSGPFGSYAMGSYPYPSSYMLSGLYELPAFPMRAACQGLAGKHMSDDDIIMGMKDGVSLYYNASGEVPCYTFKEPSEEDEKTQSLWNVQWCIEQFMPFAMDGVHDMFWEDKFSLESSIKSCQQQFGITPRPLWLTQLFGGRDLQYTSNIVFSNGEYDPWKCGGVTVNISDTVTAISIAEGGHHVDLMWSHQNDTNAIVDARKYEIAQLKKWLETYKNSRDGQSDAPLQLEVSKPTIGIALRGGTKQSDATQQLTVQS